jgi:hypothetical protein
MSASTEMMKRGGKAKARARGGETKAEERAEDREEKRKEEHRARGGETKGPGDIGEDGSMKGMESYTAGKPKVEEEAERRAKGGAIRKERMPRMIHGSAPHHNGNRPGRKSGGSVGADSHPMTEASRLRGAEGLSREGGVDREDD